MRAKWDCTTIILTQWAVTDYLKYVGNLWDKQALEKIWWQERNQMVLIFERSLFQFHSNTVTFCNLCLFLLRFYTNLPPKLFKFLNSPSRTFIVVPRSKDRHFVPASNGLAWDEIEAHTGMFSPRTNDGYNHHQRCSC